MGAELANLIGVGAALLGGGAVKWFSKKKGAEFHKAAAPLVAIGVATAVRALGGEPDATIGAIVMQGGLDGGLAIGLQSGIKNVGEYARRKKE